MNGFTWFQEFLKNYTVNSTDGGRAIKVNSVDNDGSAMLTTSSPTGGGRSLKVYIENQSAGAGVASVNSGVDITIDNTDPTNPIVNFTGTYQDPITVVANYSALPAVASVLGDFYWCSASQGTSWLPGGLGGTYYSAGLYYSNGVTWEFLAVPYQATQAVVHTGTVTDQFVTPATLTGEKDATGGIVGLTLFKINFKNAANTFTSFFTNSNTAARTYTFKDADGTIAFTSDITGTNSGTNTGDETAARIGALINGSSAATPNDADLVATAESSVLKKITWTNVKTFLKTYFDAIYQAILTAANVHTFVDSLTAMTTPVDADRMIIVDNSASLAKKITWANIKATLKSYFDAIYATLASPTFTGTVTTPAIIVSSETASRVAILDASKNIKSADTTTYPSLTELAYLKGVTSALQTQLAKMPKNYAFSAGYSATLSAGTDEVAFSILIPAGTAITNDSINLYQSHSCNNSANAKSVCVYLSTANETVGAAISGSGTKIATITGLTGAGVLSSALVRHFNARSNTSLINIYSVLSLGTDSGTVGAVTSAITIPTLASDIYLVGTVNRANAGDTVTINMCQVQIMKS